MHAIYCYTDGLQQYKSRVVVYILQCENQHVLYVLKPLQSRLILGLHPTKERRRYTVTPSLIGLVRTYIQPWEWAHLKESEYMIRHIYVAIFWALYQN